MEYNLVEIWLRRDPIRWISGVLGGLVAGAVAMGVGMLIAQSGGLELWFPIKLMATIVLGPVATEIGPQTDAIVTGVIITEIICVFWGFVFAHFTGTNSLKALLPMGVVWGIFLWIFNWNLFLQSFKPIFAARIPAGPVFPICIAYGVSLVSVAFFDRILRGSART